VALPEHARFADASREGDARALSRPRLTRSPLPLSPRARGSVRAVRFGAGDIAGHATLGASLPRKAPMPSEADAGADRVRLSAARSSCTAGVQRRPADCRLAPPMTGGGRPPRGKSDAQEPGMKDFVFVAVTPVGGLRPRGSTPNHSITSRSRHDARLTPSARCMTLGGRPLSRIRPHQSRKVLRRPTP